MYRNAYKAMYVCIATFDNYLQVILLQNKALGIYGTQ